MDKYDILKDLQDLRAEMDNPGLLPEEVVELANGKIDELIKGLDKELQ